MPTTLEEDQHIERVHVINKVEGNSPVISLNAADGKMDTFEKKLDDWIFHPAGDDLAICPLSAMVQHRARWVDRERFVTEDNILQARIGPGSDVFMVGRFKNHEGKGTNAPSVRFGNIAMMNVVVM
ncbi:MAG: hypothetical protein ACYDBJ_14855 [Aggregatilineales bacterium]